MKIKESNTPIEPQQIDEDSPFNMKFNATRQRHLTGIGMSLYKQNELTNNMNQKTYLIVDKPGNDNDIYDTLDFLYTPSPGTTLLIDGKVYTFFHTTDHINNYTISRFITFTEQ